TINYTGNTSMEIGIKVVAEDIRQRTVRHTHTCYFTMVAMDDSNKPTAVPPLQLTSTDQIRRWNKALKRREAQKKLQAMMRAIARGDGSDDFDALPVIPCPRPGTKQPPRSAVFFYWQAGYK